MATSPIGGGAIDVATIVSQLMQLERRPLVALQKRENEIQARLTALGRVQGALSSLQTALDKLRQPAAFFATRATVAGEGATAVSSSSAAVGRYSVSVTQLARAQSAASAPVASASTDLGAGTVRILGADGVTELASLAIGDGGPGTLAELRDEINAANIGVRASLVNDAGQVRLVLNAKETGASNAFTVEVGAGLTGLSFATVQSAQDAQFSVNGLALTSPSNTVGDVIEGVTLTLTKAPPAGSPPGTTVDAEVAVDVDPAQVRATVEEFVKAYNDVRKLVADLTRFDPNTRTAAVLNGEGALRRIDAQLQAMVAGAIGAAAGDYVRLSEVGVEAQRDGGLKLDAAKFDNALTADPARVARLFTTVSAVESEQGFAVRLRALVRSFIDPQGALDARQEGLRSSIRALDAQQERLEARLALVQARLTREYSKLDALVSSRQSQSVALANALAGLPKIDGKA